MDNSHLNTFPIRQANCDGVFRAVADPTRRRLLQLLIVEELNVTELVEILSQPQSTISRHLRVLRETNLVDDRRVGTAILYSVRTQPVSKIAEGCQRDPSDLIIQWLKCQTLSTCVQDRLQHVLQSRRSDSSSFFNRLGKRWDELRTAAFGEAFATEAFLSLLPRDWTVADIGTGTGYLLPLLSETFRQVLAIEPAEEMVACSRQRTLTMGAKNVAFCRGNLAHLPLAGGSCDLALAILVLHHVHSPAEALAEMHRVLKPGGRALIIEQCAHDNQAFYERMQDLWWGFSSRELTCQMMETGFRRIRHRSLTKVRQSSQIPDSPALFVLIGERD